MHSQLVGWQFNATVSTATGSYSWITPPPGAAGPRSASTGADRAATLQWRPTVAMTSTINVSETDKPGYQFVPATCQVKSLANPTPQPLSITTNGSSFTANLGSTDIVTCDVKNKKTNPDVTITKVVDRPVVLANTQVTYTITLSTGDTP